MWARVTQMEKGKSQLGCADGSGSSSMLSHILHYLNITAALWNILWLKLRLKKKKHPKTKKTNLTDTRILEKVRIARRYLPDGKNCSSTELLANRFLRSLRCHQNRNLDLSVYSEPRQRGTKMPLLWVETNIVKWVIKGSCPTPSPLTSLFLHVVWKSWKLKIWSLKKD